MTTYLQLSPHVNTEDPVGSFVNIVNLVKQFKNTTFEDAVCEVAAQHYELCTKVMNRVGWWPSSDPAVYALQRLYSTPK